MRRITVVIMFVAFALGVAALVPPASAEETGQAMSASASVVDMGDGSLLVRTAPMRIVGFDRQVARAHGVSIIVDQQGGESAVIASPDGGFTTLGTIGGDCGTSWVTLADIGDRRYSVWTGFTVNDPAVLYHWRVWIQNPSSGWYRTHEWGSSLALQTEWYSSAQDTIPYNRGGWYTATVEPPASWALLWYGSVCYSGGPTSGDWIY